MDKHALEDLLVVLFFRTLQKLRTLLANSFAQIKHGAGNPDSGKGKAAKMSKYI